MNYILRLSLVLLIFGCKDRSNPSPLRANEIIKKAIEVSGGDNFERSLISFDFRDHHYKAKRHHGRFKFSRLRLVDSMSVLDILSNAGFERLIDEKPTVLSDSIVKLYTASVNSVHYFSVLPYGLDGPAVNHELLGEEQIKGKNYYKLRITFDQEGGGEDYEDVFIYWIAKETFKLDYLAYSYNEVAGVGMRFRQAYNERYIEGLRFVDYKNFKTETSAVSLEDLGLAFENNALTLLSRIELKTIEVVLLND